MKIREFYARFPRTYSFEVFPPSTDSGVVQLYETLAELQALGPRFISVTFRPDRSSRDRTFQIAVYVKRYLGLESMFHFTCLGASQEELVRDLDQAWDLGLENILALRGDPPREPVPFVPLGHRCRYACELVALIKERYDFGIGVAGYPEGHVECPHPQDDLQHLKQKIEAGGEFVITQLFFANHYFYDFVERAREIGIEVPIIPGILPILSGTQAKRFASLGGVTIPPELERALARLGDNDAEVQRFGVDYATQQCLDLLEHGVPGIHFYCLNRSTSVREIFKHLGTRGDNLPFR